MTVSRKAILPNFSPAAVDKRNCSVVNLSASTGREDKFYAPGCLLLNMVLLLLLSFNVTIKRKPNEFLPLLSFDSHCYMCVIAPAWPSDVMIAFGLFRNKEPPPVWADSRQQNVVSSS